MLPEILQNNFFHFDIGHSPEVEMFNISKIDSFSFEIEEDSDTKFTVHMQSHIMYKTANRASLYAVIKRLKKRFPFLIEYDYNYNHKNIIILYNLNNVERFTIFRRRDQHNENRIGIKLYYKSMSHRPYVLLNLSDADVEKIFATTTAFDSSFSEISKITDIYNG